MNFLFIIKLKKIKLIFNKKKFVLIFISCKERIPLNSNIKINDNNDFIVNIIIIM